MEERLDTFMFNYTVASTEMLGAMTKFKNDMKRNQVCWGGIHKWRNMKWRLKLIEMFPCSTQNEILDMH